MELAAPVPAAPSLGLAELLFAGWAVCHELGRRWATPVFGSEDVGGAPRWRSFVGLGTSAGALPLLVCHTGFEPQPSRLICHSHAHAPLRTAWRDDRARGWLLGVGGRRGRGNPNPNPNPNANPNPNPNPDPNPNPNHKPYP